MTQAKIGRSLTELAEMLGGELVNVGDPDRIVTRYDIRPISCGPKSLYIAYRVQAVKPSGSGRSLARQ